MKYIETLKKYKTEREVDEYNESYSYSEGSVKAINDCINLYSKFNNPKMTAGEVLDFVKPCFPDAFINRNNELILEPKNNIYFSLHDVATKFDVDLKMIKWVSRPSCKGLSNVWQKRVRNSFNAYFRRVFEKSEIELIYTKLGNGANPDLCIEFVASNLNLSLLKVNNS